MDELTAAAQWIAPAATMIAAMMTAANLGARVTGWGFAVFTIGSICWSLIGATTGQTNLLATNGFLTIVNLVGIWRWLGRQAKYEDGAQNAAAASEQGPGPSLMPATGVSGLPVADREGNALGRCVEALIDRESGRIDYIVIASTNGVGLGETLRGVERSSCRFDRDAVTLVIGNDAFDRLPPLADREWPSRLSPA